MNQVIAQEILNAIQNVRYGSVEITVQNSQVVQIEIKEKVRFDHQGLKKPKVNEDHHS
jgi:hypothetical protein